MDWVQISLNIIYLIVSSLEDAAHAYAEAVVYAIIGVTLGYIMGQGLGKVLIYFNLLQGMNLNYSSWSAIVSSLLVMGVVLLSTIYPAKIAAKSSVPDTVRRWIPPDPDGDCWEF